MYFQPEIVSVTIGCLSEHSRSEITYTGHHNIH